MNKLATWAREHELWRMLAFALAYAGAIILSTLLPSTLDTVLAIWPAGGIGLAAILLVGKGRRVSMALMIYVAGYVANLLIGKPALASLGYMLANSLESLLCALTLLRVCKGDFRLDRTKGISALFFAVLVVNAATALLGAATASLASGLSFSTFWFSWWVGDGLSILVIAPIVLSLMDRRYSGKSVLKRSSFEHLVFFGIWLSAIWLAFNFSESFSGFSPHPYILIVLLSWPASRFGTRSLSLALFALAILTISSHAVLQGPSPLHGDTEEERLLFAQSFLLVAAFMSWLLQATFAERVESEKKEKEDHERLRGLEDNLPNGATYQVVLDTDGRVHFTYMSLGIKAFSGVGSEEIIADPGAYFSRVLPEDLALLASAREESANTLKPASAMVRFRRDDGAIRWHQIASSPRRLADGGTIWDGLIMDTTAETETRSRLSAREHQYATLIEQAADGIFITDALGNYTEVNAAATAMLGYSRTELLGMNVRDLILPSDLKRQEVHFEDLHRGNTLVTQRTLVRKDGSHLFTEINAKSLSDGRMMGIVRDVSERRWQDLILATRARIAEAVIGVSETDLLRLTIDVAEEVTDSRIGFFHHVDEKQGSLSLQMWSTSTEARMCAAQASGGHDAVDVAGVWVDCIHERKPVIHNDYPALAHRKGLPEGHAPIIRELLVPIMRNDVIVAIIGVGNKTREYGLEDVKRIEMLADLTWDVLEKREAERRLRESEERFSTIFRESPLATSLTRLETGEFVDLNNAALQLFGYDRREEMIGRTVAELELYEDPEVRRRIVSSLRDDGSSEKIETRFRKRSGELFDATMVVEIIHIGGEHYLVVQTQDSTERNRAERELRASETRLRLSQAVALMGNWAWDTRTNRVQWSEGMYRVFGLDKADFDPNLDSIVERCIHPDDRQRVRDSNRAVMEEAHPAETEYRVVWPDGSVHDIWAMPGASTRDKDGSIVLLTGIVQDISERKRAEESIRRTLAEKEVLLRELYHRSNNNMQVITALLEFQAAEIADERLTRVISDTQDRISSIALVNRKLYEAQDLSHIDLREYIEELARILSQSYGRRDGQVTFVPDLEEVRVLIDTAIPCGLILNELISNVFKHAYPEDGKGDIMISLRKLADGTIKLRVADHGVGVPEGFDFMRDGHIGLQSIVGLCANQLRGKVLFDTKNGLACEISFTDNLYEARI